MKIDQILTKTFPGYDCLEELTDVKCYSKSAIKILKELDKAFTLLRRFYNIVEDEHLNNRSGRKLGAYSTIIEEIPRNLINEIFNFLSSKDKKFNELFIKRQKKYRRKVKQNIKKLKELDERKLYEELKFKILRKEI